MITYSIIQKSQLEGANRLDAEYYQPEYLENAKRLGSFSTVKLGDIAFITDGEHGSPIFDEESGIKYFSAQHVKDGYIDPSGAENISKIIDEKNERSRLKTGDVLLSTVGTIGFAGLVTRDLLPANIDRHVARIALKEKNLDPEFLVAFLNSKYGRFQSIRQSTGNVQLNLFLSKIREFEVPKNNDPRISKLIRKALGKREASKSLYSQAENLLLEKLGLKDFRPEDELCYIINSSDMESARRADAEFFQPKYEKLISKIKKHKSVPLLKIVENVQAKFNPEAQPDKTFQYVELANIDSSIGVIDGFSEVLGQEAPSRARRLLRTGDVIVSSVEGSLEKVALVDKEQSGYLASTGFFQFRSKGTLPEALLVMARSLVLQMQFKRQTSGTILTAVPKDAIKNIVIPILPKPTQQKIADFVKKSHQSRKKSKELLEEAKKKVEEMIEKGGEKYGKNPYKGCQAFWPGKER